MEKKAKTFDCIAMKRAAQKIIRAQVQGMTREQEIAYFRESGEALERHIEADKPQQGDRPSSDAP